MNKQSKIQSLIIRHLLRYGTLDIKLPDGIVLEIGITQEDENGNLVKSDDYCFVSATRDNKKTLLDSFNLGLSFVEEDDIMIIEDEEVDNKGRLLRHVDVI